MPFGVYERVGGTYSLVRPFSLASDVVGSSDFATFLAKLAPPNCSPKNRCIDPQGWPVTPAPAGCYCGTFCGGHPSPGLLWTLPIGTVKTWLGAHSHHALVANITPRRPTASLGEIVGIWGYYYPAWTPDVGPWTVIMLKLKMLWVDVVVPPRRFPAPPKPGRSVFEFFYATCTCCNNKKWKMRGHGLYNSPLLFPDALACLFRVIRNELKKPPEVCGEGLDLCCCVCCCVC